MREEDDGAIILICAFPYRRAQHPSSHPRAGKAPHSQLLFSTALLLFFRLSSSAPPSGAQSTLGATARRARRTRGSALRGNAGPLPGLPRLGGPQAGARGSWPGRVGRLARVWHRLFLLGPRLLTPCSGSMGPALRELTAQHSTRQLLHHLVNISRRSSLAHDSRSKPGYPNPAVRTGAGTQGGPKPECASC